MTAVTSGVVAAGSVDSIVGVAQSSCCSSGVAGRSSRADGIAVDRANRPAFEAGLANSMRRARRRVAAAWGGQ